MTRVNPYVQYYLNQQKGYGSSPVFRGAPWQRGYGQMGYGLGGLFRSLARAVMPLAKSGAKALGKIALNTGAGVLNDVTSGKSVKEAAKSRLNQAAKDAGKKAVNRVQRFAQTGRGKRSKKTKRKTGKKRKASPSDVIHLSGKRRKAAKKAEDIFG